MKTSHLQYLTLLEFMEKHGDLSKPSGGPRGRHYIQEKWKQLVTLLNIDGTGDSRSEEKWRKVWSDWKSNTRKKKARIIKHANSTGGGPALQLSLTDMENRVMHLVGEMAAVGMPIEEAGFQQVDDELQKNPVPEPSQTTAEDYTIDWNTPGTSSQAVVVEPEIALSSPVPDGPTESPWKPPPSKKRKNEDLAQMFVESDRSAREYARERYRVNEQLERERLRQRDEELRIRELELRERMRQRDAEIQLQAQWLEFMQECLNVIKRYFER